MNKEEYMTDKTSYLTGRTILLGAAGLLLGALRAGAADGTAELRDSEALRTAIAKRLQILILPKK